jgi:chromosome segregation ATPase
MPAISKIRFTNVVYENGEKRYNDDIFEFDSYNGAILLENGGGKTVFVQTALQAILPNIEVADRKVKNTLSLQNTSAHIAIEWILSERPRRYAVTAVTLFMNKEYIDSYKYVYEYLEKDDNSIEKIPFVRDTIYGSKRPSTKEEMAEYYGYMSQNRMNAKTFKTIRDYHTYIEDNFKIIPSEWRKIALINGAEGGVEAFFDACKTTGQLVDNLLIPTVEEALAGDGTKDFVEIFERQREHFKRYRQLNARIEESKKVEEQINLYSEVFKQYDEAKTEEIKAKENLKSLDSYVKQEAEVIKDKIAKNSKETFALYEQEELWKQKNLSYELKNFESDMNKEEKAYTEVFEGFEKLNNTKVEKEKKAASLQISKYKKDIKIEDEKASLISKQLETLEQDKDIEAIKETLEENGSRLRGYYLDEEEKLEKEKNLIEAQLSNIIKQLKDSKVEIEAIRSKDKALLKNKSSLEGKVELLINDIKRINKSILDNPNEANIKDEIKTWKDRITELENKVFEASKQKKIIIEEQQTIKEALVNLRKALEEVNEEKNKLTNEVNNIDESRLELLYKIKEFRSSWLSFEADAIYSKQNTIVTQIESRLHKLIEEKEKSILQERLAHRYADEYKDSEYYTADAILEKKIEQWRSGFNYIESGTRYIQRISRKEGIEEAELAKAYPYWILTVVTSEDEVNKVKDKASKNFKDISHPIIVLSEKEAKNKAFGEGLLKDENIIYPFTWTNNINQTYFQEWQKDIVVKAEETTKLREEKEVELSSCKELHRDITLFYNKYPYEHYLELSKALKTVKEKIEETSASIKNNEDRLSEIDIELKKLDNDVKEFNTEQRNLEDKVVKGQESINKSKEKEDNEVAISLINTELELIEVEARRAERNLKENEEIKNELSLSLKDKKRDISSLKAEELYEEVKSLSPKYSDLSKEVLIKERTALIDQLNNKQLNRGQLDEQLKNALNLKKLHEKQLDDYVKKLDFTLEGEIEFPIRDEKELADLNEEVKKLKDTIDKLRSEVEAAGKKFDKSKNLYEFKKDEYLKTYKEIVSFNQELELIKPLLSKEKEDLKKKRTYLVNEKERLEKEEKSIDIILRSLEVFNAGYGYLNEEIELRQLPDELVQKLSNNIKQIIDAAKKKLEEAKRFLDKKNLEAEEQKSIFIKFCEAEILDVKLKEMATAGVRFKDTYKDIIEWKKMMSERISRTIEIAQNDIREHDREVQQFINQLHSYLVTMVQELKSIPKKTRIKVEEEWKEVFIFNIPEWEEKEGKEELAKHIDWMLNQLEGDRFKDENGMELAELANKEIEKWLKSKQLLQIVMKQDNIKVKCRKVTNDGKMRSAPFSWEVSNSWSGGEKWSKNMSLFLGILNYLAEKRKQIIPTKANYRTVIVDNPFGKASSDHVLDPVFFIADQLGFQIIALTAHAEGKFIRTYFPIVYSLRLRSSMDNSTQIMTKEREIKHTYFRDNAPETLIRFGEAKQLGFDLDSLFRGSEA